MAVALFQGDNLTIVSDGPEVDNKTGEYHSFTATPTKFTIESGATASDHIIEQPDTLEVSWVMSNLDEQGKSYGTRAATLLESLRGLIKDRGLYQVVTHHRLYPSMAIVSVTAEHVGPFSGALKGRIAFSQVNKEVLERVKIPASKVKKKTAASQTNGGRAEAKEPTEPQKSVLSQIFKK